MSPPSASVLRPLLWPVYAPTVAFAVGASALLPAQVLLALRLGFSTAQVALLGTWLGIAAVVCALAAGRLVHAVGERRALVATTVPACAVLLVAWAACAYAVPGARWVLVASLTAMAAADEVWGIARQGMVAELAPAAHLGRAMNTYGAAQRIGRACGPLLAAALLTVRGPADVLGLAAIVAAGALWLILRHLPGGSGAGGGSRGGAPDPAAMRRARTALVVLGLGVVALAALRAAKETLVPLWGAQQLHLADSPVALVMGVTALMELVLFWPAGLALDRLGRAPVVVTCLTLMGLGLVLLPLRGDLTWFVAAALVVGLGDGVGSGIVKTLGVDLAPPSARSRFLGQWQSMAAAGRLLAPTLASALIAVASLGVALTAIGATGLVGAAWMAYWTPRWVPRRRPAAGSATSGPADQGR